MERPFPPSPRRRALARQAGLNAASPLITAALALAAAAVAAVVIARGVAQQLGAWIAAACAGHATLAADAAPRAVLELAAPVLGLAAALAIAAHLAQTRALWLPRRRIEGAPQAPRPRGLELAAAAVIGVVAFAWLWMMAPRIARLVELPGALAAAAGLVGSFVVALAIAWFALGVVDALIRHALLARSLAMTPAEKRADDRLAAVDPRWRTQRARLARGPSASEAVASAALLVLGDGAAVAIAWDATRQPVPLRTATGRGALATQLLGLARRYRISVHRDPALAARLVVAEGPIPEGDWPQLAEVVAALRR